MILPTTNSFSVELLARSEHVANPPSHPLTRMSHTFQTALKTATSNPNLYRATTSSSSAGLQRKRTRVPRDQHQ